MKKKVKKTNKKELAASFSADLFDEDIDDITHMQMDNMMGQMFSIMSEATTKFQQTAVALMQLIVEKDNSFNNEATILSLYERVMDHVIKTSPLKEVMSDISDKSF